MSAQESESGFRRFLGRFAPRSPADATHPQSATKRTTAPRASLCLAIVSDGASPFLSDVLSAARPHVASWVAIDTGEFDSSVIDSSVTNGGATDAASTDTASTAGSILHRELGDLPGRLVARPGMHPARARNELLTLVPGDATHVLVLDDDLILSCEGALGDLLASVPGDAFVVPVDDHGFEHHRPLILRTGRSWTVLDDARRTVRSDTGVVSTTFDAVRFRRMVDGSSMWRSLIADREHLYVLIESDPRDVGVMFRLARTLADLGETSAALWWFARCAKAGGGSEEAYCAWLFIGEQHLLAGRLDEAASAFMWAVQVRPARIEAYYHLARIFNADQDYAKARMWAESGMMQNPGLDTMYLQPWIRRWGLPFEWATAAWWTGDAIPARSLFESLVESDLLVEPWVTRATTGAQRALPGQEPLRFG